MELELYRDIVEPLPTFSALRLQKMREKLYITQKHAAFLCRVKQQTWSTWERGVSPMPEVAWAYFYLCVNRPIRKRLAEKHRLLEKVERPDEW